MMIDPLLDTSVKILDLLKGLLPQEKQATIQIVSRCLKRERQAVAMKASEKTHRKWERGRSAIDHK